MEFNKQKANKSNKKKRNYIWIEKCQMTKLYTLHYVHGVNVGQNHTTGKGKKTII